MTQLTSDIGPNETQGNYLRSLQAGRWAQAQVFSICPLLFAVPNPQVPITLFRMVESPRLLEFSSVLSRAVPGRSYFQMRQNKLNRGRPGKLSSTFRSLAGSSLLPLPVMGPVPSAAGPRGLPLFLQSPQPCQASPPAHWLCARLFQFLLLLDLELNCVSGLLYAPHPPLHTP